MIRIIRKIWWFFLLAIILAMLHAGCSERVPDDTVAGITFSSRLSQKTGRQSAISDVFALKENEDVYAVIAIDSLRKARPGDLMFHIDWIDPDGRSFYLKRTDLDAGDSVTALISSVSVSPANRPPGEYKVRIYLFRELVAERSFELKAGHEIKKVKADIILFKSLDKETGEMKGIDTIFEIKKKGILRAQIGLKNLDVYKDDELPIRLEWIGPDGKDFYSKKIDFLKPDSISAINSSISITPDKREAGEYFLRVFLFDEMVGEKSFELQPAE